MSKRRIVSKEKMNPKETSAYQWELMAAPAGVFGSLFLYLLIAIVALNGSFWEEVFVKKADTTAEFLQGYLNWNRVMEGGPVLGLLIMLAVGAWAMYRVCWNLELRNKARGNYDRSVIRHEIQVGTAWICVVCIGMACMLSYFVLCDSGLQKEKETIQKELKFIRKKDFYTKELYLYSEPDEKHRIPFAPKDSAYATGYKVAAGDKTGHIVVPSYLGFSIDEEHPYENEASAPVSNKKENAARYRVTYTPEYHIVVDIEVLPPLGPQGYRDGNTE